MLVIKIIAILIAAVAISKSYIDYRKRLESKAMFFIWTVIWLAATTIIVYPLLIDELARYTKDQTITLGSLSGIAFIFMLYIVYRVYAKAARIEYQQAELIRKLGLKKSLKK
jgi:hypothetical protein